jgi:type II secretory pathway component PulC
VKLIATFVTSPPEYSSALIADDDSPDLPRVYSLGHLLHGREVVSIEWDRVGLEKENGDIEYLTMRDGTLAAVADAGEGPAEAGDGSVSQTSENRFTISRDAFEKNINDLESLSKMGRALLHRGPDGEYDGYRLSAIRRGTLADQLGIKNGDIIHSVNGESLNSMQSAMNAYNTMKSGSSFCFEVSRRGTPTELCYDIR